MFVWKINRRPVFDPDDIIDAEFTETVIENEEGDQDVNESE